MQIVKAKNDSVLPLLPQDGLENGACSLRCIHWLKDYAIVTVCRWKETIKPEFLKLVGCFIPQNLFAIEVLWQKRFSGRSGSRSKSASKATSEEGSPSIPASFPHRSPGEKAYSGQCHYSLSSFLWFFFFSPFYFEAPSSFWPLGSYFKGESKPSVHGWRNGQVQYGLCICTQ